MLRVRTSIEGVYEHRAARRRRLHDRLDLRDERLGGERLLICSKNKSNTYDLLSLWARIVV